MLAHCFTRAKGRLVAALALVWFVAAPYCASAGQPFHRQRVRAPAVGSNRVRAPEAPDNRVRAPEAPDNRARAPEAPDVPERVPQPAPGPGKPAKIGDPGCVVKGDARKGGMTIEGLSITSGDYRLKDGRYYDVFPLAVNEGEVISAAMKKWTEPGTREPAIWPQMDPYLIVVDSQGKFVAENDNEPGNGFSARVHYQVPKTGVYAVYATTQRPDFHGANTYRLHVWVYRPQTVTIKP